ncbi:SDR family oxidoreductase [Leucobacter allii]|uniref:SDR family oxidoreductase n=1 Tax=Leucobacter allii TaxID=2932247 RepID=A0ABY4FNL5_9MICO|nr:SDR family oxidoreductase [Leucobacter allii]UOQ57875.1 SDR family oxidoreductase [Leucobacter allii]UOR02516.1 SDR family oxidoreductase [Leucobacter allii]
MSMEDPAPAALRGRVAVTGGSGGIGTEICRALEERGWRTYALDRVPGDGAGEFIECDLLDGASVERAVASVYAELDTPVFLVTAAGIVEDDVAAEELDIELVDRVMGVNFRGVFLANQAFGRELIARGGGAIVNIASMSGNHVVNSPQRQCIYNASKAAVTALTKSLAVEWGPRGVRVNALSPGYIDTPLNGLKARMHAEWNAGTVLGRMGTPLEAAHAVEFLLSERSGYFVGAELLMDGGFSLR